MNWLSPAAERANVFPVRYELGFYTPEDGILHSHRGENLKSYTVSTFVRDHLFNVLHFIHKTLHCSRMYPSISSVRIRPEIWEQFNEYIFEEFIFPGV
jgi:hypothetical protein